MLSCPSCGSAHDAQALFCPVCGTDLLRTPPVPPVQLTPDGGANQPVGEGGRNEQSGYRPNVPPTVEGAGWSGWQGAANPPDAAPYTPHAPYSSPPPGYEGNAQLQPWWGGGLFAIGERRDPVMVLVFSLLTCGLYSWYWWFVTATDVKNALRREDINPAMELVLSFVTCGIYLIFLYYKYPQMMLEMQERVRLPRNDISTVSLLLGIFFPLAAMFIIQTELNKIWDAADGRA